MGNKILTWFILFLFINVMCSAQDWRSPVNFPIKLSGTFCELRTNHFHHGIDIKSSKGVSGDKIHAIGDGIIHRLRVQAAGYGNSIYIRHPEGYVSVYAHLSSIDPILDSIVLAHQYERETYEIDLVLDSMAIPVEKGQVIGRMGSTGYSFGPHLHFEIRDAKTETTINPLHFGFPLKDGLAPNLSMIRFDFLRKDGSIYHRKKFDVKQGRNTAKLAVDTVRLGAWRCGIALRTQDKMNDTHNRNGLYSIEIIQDSTTIFHFKADSAHFKESRAVNILKDEVTYRAKKERWYLAYDMPGSPLQDYLLSERSLGWVRPFADKPQRLTIKVADFSGNERTLNFVLVRDEKMVEQESRSHNYLLPFHEPNIIRLQHAELNCPDGTFYRDQTLTIEETKEATQDYLSPVVSFRGEEISFHAPCTLRFPTDAIDSATLRHAVVVRCQGDDLFHVGRRLRDGGVETRITAWGEYVLYADRTAPTMKVVHCPDIVRTRDKLRFTIKDEFESKGSAKEVFCRATLDGQFILAKHDVKSNTFAIPLTYAPLGEHVLQLSYGDAAGNTKTWTKNLKITR